MLGSSRDCGKCTRSWRATRARWPCSQVLYLRYLGFDADNEPFARHARYFRDALVRANYRNAKAKVMPDASYLLRFFENLLSGEHHELRSRDLMVSELYADPSLLRNVDPSRAISKP